VPHLEPETAEELEACPFCGGREERTPPETLRLGDGDPWGVRVVPNLYPAFEVQEVVIHSPRHLRTFADLSAADAALVVEAWRERARTARTQGFAYLHALVNEGRVAGASLPHSHSQLVWLREAPAAVRAEAGDPCRLCALLDEERAAGDRVVAEQGGLVALAPAAGRGPYELLLAPTAHESGGFESTLLPTALGLLAVCVRALRAVEGPVPWNAWLHDGDHWHIELVPRLTTFAGVELGAGIYVTTVAPEDAAGRLREALAAGEG
jgi:UDPglucose--hexose-1-phosphate uridylyltransferase